MSAGAAGYRYELMWTVDTLGWQGVTPATVGAALPGRRRARRDHFVACRLGIQLAAALPGVISDLQAQGYAFVTAAGML